MEKCGMCESDGILERLVADVINIQEKIIDTAVRRCIAQHNLKREEVVLLVPNDIYTGKYYLIRKADAKARVGERNNLSKAFCLGGFKQDLQKGEILWQNY